MLTENWRAVVGYEGLYEVSDLGSVRSVQRVVQRGSTPQTIRARILKPTSLTKNYYPSVALCRGGVCVKTPIYRIVALAFLGPRPPGMDVAHDDGDRKNSVLANLRYATRKENCADTLAHGRSIRGERQPNAKLTEVQVAAIRASSDRGVDLARIHGVAQQTICNIRKGRRWQHVTA